MLEVYSENVTVPAGAAFPLDVVKVLKGATVTTSGGSAIQLNRAGVYNVSVSASLEPASAGAVTVDLYKDGALLTGAGTEFTGTADTAEALAFTTLVQCPQNNIPCCCCTSPTTLTLINTSEVDVTGSVTIVVTKLC